MKKLTVEEMSAVIGDCDAYGLVRGGKAPDGEDDLDCFFGTAEQFGYKPPPNYGDEVLVFDEFAALQADEIVRDPTVLLNFAEFNGFVE